MQFESRVASQVFNAHLQGFATQVDRLRASGCLSGGERGALAEALLAVAAPSGAARVGEVLRWLLESVQSRWVPVPGGAASSEIARLTLFSELAKGENGDGAAGLSKHHWELFHDVQLTERCLRRSGGDHDPSGVGVGGGSAAAPASDAVAPARGDPPLKSETVPAGLCRAIDPPPANEECPASAHVAWTLALCEAVCAATHEAWTPFGVSESKRSNIGLDRALEMSPEETAAHLAQGPAKVFALGGCGAPPDSETVSSARSWLRGLRESAYAILGLLAVHAPLALYSSDAAAAAVSRAAHGYLESQRDRHVRALVHTVVRPILARCPAAPRPRWQAALTTGLVPHMHERLSAAWSRSRRAGFEGWGVAGVPGDDGEESSFAAAARAGGGAAAVAELVSDRVTRDLTRDHCALLELFAAPDGTFGRKTKGSGLTGRSRGDAAGDAAAAERLANGGGRHVLEWISATRNAGAGDRCARAALGTAAAAITWGDSESAGRALGFLRGVVAAAAASAAAEGGRDESSRDASRIGIDAAAFMDAAFREEVGGRVLSACLAGLTVPTNAAHQADLLGVIRDVVLRLVPVTRTAGDTLLALPGMTRAELDRLLLDLSTIRSEKKAASRVKETLVAVAGGGDALRAFAEARASSSGAGAIQMPSVVDRRGGSGAFTGGAWTEEEVNGIGLNPLTANERPTQ